MELQRAIPRINITFNKEACMAKGAAVNYSMIYCDADETPHAHFVAQTMVENWLRHARETNTHIRPYPNLSYRRMSHADCDKIYANGYSIMRLVVGVGPVLHWGHPNDVSVLQLMNMATIIKTFQHYFDTELKMRIADKLNSKHSLDFESSIEHSRFLVHDLMIQVSRVATAHRLVYGKRDLYQEPASQIEDEYFDLWFQFPGYSPEGYKIRVSFENFNLRYTVPRKLFDLFDSGFGSEFTQHMVPLMEEE